MKQIDVTVSRQGQDFRFSYSGDADADGQIEVRGNRAVHLQFTASPGSGVKAVRFATDPEHALKVGDRDDPGCPPTTDSAQFDDKKRPHENVVSIRDRKTEAGEYHYMLNFLVVPSGQSEEVAASDDPVIINK